MPAVASLELGHNLEEFTIVKVLGAGGFGITYQAIDRSLQRNVAIKEYFPQQFAERSGDCTIVPRVGAENAETFKWGLNRFLTEARTLARIEHQNVVKVSRYFERNGTAYLVMAFEEGHDLEDWLRERTSPPTSDDIKRLILPLLDGLEAIHQQGLIHRDIKPRNVVIRANGTPVLIDFGSARAVGQQQTTLTTLISPGYSPPEQYSSDPSAQGPWTDIYAMAGVIYRMIGGSGPPEALNRVSGTRLKRAAEVARTPIDPNILAAVDRGLELDAGGRPRSVEEYRAVLLGRTARAPKAEAAADPDATYVRKPSDEKEPRQKARWPWIAAAAGLAAVFVAGFVVFLNPTPDQVERVAPVTEQIAQPTDPQPETAVAAAPVVEPAPVASYALTLNLTPGDAVADVGGQPYTAGMTMPPGDYTITVTKPGFVTATREITIDRDSVVDVALEKQTYPFTVAASPADAQVRIKNIRRAYQPGFALLPGDYDVEVTAPGHQPWEGTVTHGAAPTRREVTLSPLYTFTLNLNPEDATVRLASGPYTPGMQLPGGEYEVAVEKPGYQTESQTILLDRNTVTDINLTPSLGVLTLILRPSDARVTLPDLGRAYTPGMRLPVGPLRVQVSRERYESADREVVIQPGTNAIVFNLERVR